MDCEAAMKLREIGWIKGSSTRDDVRGLVRRRSRYASVALVAVFVGLGASAVWSSQATSSATRRAVVASGLSDDYANAASAVAAEESLERKYRLEPGPDVQSLYDGAADAFVASLIRVRRDGDVGDRAFVDRVLPLHESYLLSIDRLFRATDRGDTAAALKIDNEEVDPPFGAIETAVLDAADNQHSTSISQLRSLQRLERVTRTLTPIALLLGLLLATALVFCFTLAWLGWQFDVPRRDGLMRLYAPVAHDGIAGVPPLLGQAHGLAGRTLPWAGLPARASGGCAAAECAACRRGSVRDDRPATCAAG